jgi:hypothetical protein
MADTWDEAACRARLAAVTPGPWVIGGLFPTGWRLDRGSTPIGQRCHDFVGVLRRESDAIFSAHAAADLGAALAEIDRLRAKLEEADGVIAAATSAITEQLHRAVALGRECDRLQEVVRGLSERVAAQSELLSCRAEGRP